MYITTMIYCHFITNQFLTISYMNVHQKQCVVLQGLRECTKYALYHVRFIYPLSGIKNVNLSVCLYRGYLFSFSGGGVLKHK